jgi:hypothetical protein
MIRFLKVLLAPVKAIPSISPLFPHRKRGQPLFPEAKA